MSDICALVRQSVAGRRAASSRQNRGNLRQLAANKLGMEGSQNVHPLLILHLTTFHVKHAQFAVFHFVDATRDSRAMWVGHSGPLAQPLAASGKCSGFSGKRWSLSERQNQAGKASFSASDRRETRIERIEWLSKFEKRIDLWPVSGTSKRQIKDQRVAQWTKRVENSVLPGKKFEMTRAERARARRETRTMVARGAREGQKWID